MKNVLLRKAFHCAVLLLLLYGSQTLFPEPPKLLRGILLLLWFIILALEMLSIVRFVLVSSTFAQMYSRQQTGGKDTLPDAKDMRFLHSRVHEPVKWDTVVLCFIAFFLLALVGHSLLLLLIEVVPFNGEGEVTILTIIGVIIYVSSCLFFCTSLQEKTDAFDHLRYSVEYFSISSGVSDLLGEDFVKKAADSEYQINLPSIPYIKQRDTDIDIPETVAKYLPKFLVAETEKLEKHIQEKEKQKAQEESNKLQKEAQMKQIVSLLQK